jgi:hypothetical protein
VLYNVTSSYLEGRRCALARFGCSREGRRDRPQIVIGLLCAADGCPVAVEVFEGDVADQVTLGAQIAKLKQRFRLRRVVLVGDRGLVTRACIEAELKPAGLDWSPACAPRRCAGWSRMARCSFPCSTSGIWPRSTVPTIPASG